MNLIRTLVKSLLRLAMLERIGISLVNFDLLKYIDHYKWIFKPNKIPTKTITFYKKKEITKDNRQYAKKC